MPPSSSELEPQVTVVISTFNGGDWLLQTLASCQQQQPTSMEVIVVDDASTDDTPDRVAAAYPEVRAASPRLVSDGKAVVLVRGNAESWQWLMLATEWPRHAQLQD